MSPVSPFFIMPGVCAKRCQMLGPAPSASGEPSIWYADVAAPHRNPSGNCTLVVIARSGPYWRECKRLHAAEYPNDGRFYSAVDRVLFGVESYRTLTELPWPT